MYDHHNHAGSASSHAHPLMGMLQQGQQALSGLGGQLQMWASSALFSPAHAHRRMPHFAPRLAAPAGITSSLTAGGLGASSTTSNSQQGGSSQHGQKARSTPVAAMHIQGAMSPPSADAGSASSAARKAELGRATWTLLHMLAAQYPEKPTRQQQRDAREFLMCLTRMYPCGDCASHFSEIVKKDPPTVASRQDLQRWTCRVHNSVNRGLGKPTFNCDLVVSRWAPLDCAETGKAVDGCSMAVGQRGR